jgi:tungstate transport system ATP-binding protein
MAADPCYSIEGVSKTYAGRQVLQIDRLEIQRGEILALVGPSGAGKSTLLRMLNFLEPPSAGRIRYGQFEFDANTDAPLATRRQVTTVSQRPVLLDRPVQANVQFGLKLRGLRDAAGQVEAALQQVGLAHLARQQARTLSGGEAQRVALARAMVLQPAVLLLDEPTANLDPHNVGLIEQIVRTLNQEQHTTLVLVTHNIFQAHRLAHRVGFMLDGRLIEVAGVQTFFEAPSDPRTSAFVRGDMVY